MTRPPVSVYGCLMKLLPCQRHLFDIPEDVAYLNAATMTPLPKAALEAGSRGLGRKVHPWEITSADFFSDTARLRPKIARLIHADSDGIAFCAAASYGLETAARNLPITAGQHILVLADQFPSNVYPWRALARDKGAEVRTVGSQAGNRSLSDELLSAIGSQTAIIACPQVRWTDGAALVVDLSQSCGAMAFDVRAVQPDFLVCVGYKWLFGPYGMGFLYAAPHRREGRPLEQNWISRQGAADFTRLTDYRDAFEPGAQRYDMGERSNFALLPALEASVDLVLGWGIGRIADTLEAYNSRLAARLAGIGLDTPPAAERGAHYLSARLPASAPADLTRQLAGARVYVSERAGRLRITPHVYNTQADADGLVGALENLLWRSPVATR